MYYCLWPKQLPKAGIHSDVQAFQRNMCVYIQLLLLSFKTLLTKVITRAKILLQLRHVLTERIIDTAMLISMYNFKLND